MQTRELWTRGDDHEDSSGDVCHFSSFLTTELILRELGLSLSSNTCLRYLYRLVEFKKNNLSEILFWESVGILPESGGAAQKSAPPLKIIRVKLRHVRFLRRRLRGRGAR